MAKSVDLSSVPRTKAYVTKVLGERLQVANPSIVLKDVAAAFRTAGNKASLSEGELYESIAKRLFDLSDLVHSIEEE